MVLSASSPSSIRKTGNSYKYFKKQAYLQCLECCNVQYSKIDYRIYQSFIK